MKNVFNASEELFFDILIIALLSFLYFNYISMSEFTLLLGLIFSFIYFGVNFYIGYKYKLKFIDSSMSIVKLFSININYLYAPVLMIINIILVVIGSITKNIMNKSSL